MLAYQFDTAGLFIGVTDADESPLEPGTFLLPARSTLIAPQESFPDGQWPRFNGLEWELVNRPSPAPMQDALTRLADFLAQNPDVEELLDK